MSTQSNSNNPPHSTFCTLPWISINSTPTGMARLCCLSSTGPTGGVITDDNNVPHNLSTANFEDIINADYIKQIRISMLNGESLPECQTCLLKEKLGNGKSSRRLTGIKTFSNIITEEKARNITLPDGTIPVEISYLDLRFGNLCNLKCVSCYPTSSSQWYEAHVKLSGSTTFNDNSKIINLTLDNNGRYRDKGEFDWWKNDIFWENAEKHVPFLTQIYFTGGEPLLIDPHYKFLSKIIELGYADKITLEYDTNLMSLRPALSDIWSKFKQVLVSISLDDFSEQNNYIRYLSNWGTIQKNIAKLSSWNLKNLKMSFSVTWHILNSFTFLNVLDYFKENNFKNFHIRILHQPKWLDCRGLPRSTKDHLLIRYKQWSKDNPAKASSIMHLVALLEDTAYQENAQDLRWFYSNVSKLDAMHNTNWKVTFPELYSELIPYVNQ